MNDMSAVIVPRSDQISAEDFLAGPKTFTIEGVAINPGTEQPVNIKLAGEERVWRPCKSMSRVLVAAWGPDASKYTGRSLTLYRDPKVKWGGMEVGGIRVSHLSHIEREMLLQLTATKGKRAPNIVKPLAAQPLALQAQPDPNAAMREWSDKFTARVAAADTVDAVNALVAKDTRWLDKLPADLRARCDLAVSERLAVLSPGEGRADEQHGDQHDGLPDGF